MARRLITQLESHLRELASCRIAWSGDKHQQQHNCTPSTNAGNRNWASSHTSRGGAVRPHSILGALCCTSHLPAYVHKRYRNAHRSDSNGHKPGKPDVPGCCARPLASRGYRGGAARGNMLIFAFHRFVGCAALRDGYIW